MGHCSMFKHSDKHGLIQCVIKKEYREEFETLGFSRRGDEAKKEVKIESNIDPLTLHDKDEVEAVKAKCKDLKIPKYWLMKHETRVSKIKELEDDN